MYPKEKIKHSLEKSKLNQGYVQMQFRINAESNPDKVNFQSIEVQKE